MHGVSICSLVICACSFVCDAPLAGAAEAVSQVDVYSVPRLLKLKELGQVGAIDWVPHEGWVQLSMMIDPQGKPYEISVVDSAGRGVYERAAVEALSGSTFEPARSGNEVIHASFSYKYWFKLDSPYKRVSENFASDYKKLQYAINAGNKNNADRQLRTIDPQTLFEDSLFHMMLFDYQRKWGTENQQILALRGAVAGEEAGSYLPKETLVSALDSLLVLEVRRNDFGAAQSTWQKLSRVAPKERLAVRAPMMAEVDRLMKSSTPVRISAEIERGNSWFSSLFRTRFRIDRLDGAISDIKLRCARGYVQFHYQADIEYSVSTQGKCGIEVIGDPSSRFELVQL